MATRCHGRCETDGGRRVGRAPTLSWRMPLRSRAAAYSLDPARCVPRSRREHTPIAPSPASSREQGSGNRVPASDARNPPEQAEKGRSGLPRGGRQRSRLDLGGQQAHPCSPQIPGARRALLQLGGLRHSLCSLSITKPTLLS